MVNVPPPVFEVHNRNISVERNATRRQNKKPQEGKVVRIPKKQRPRLLANTTQTADVFFNATEESTIVEIFDGTNASTTVQPVAVTTSHHHRHHHRQKQQLSTAITHGSSSEEPFGVSTAGYISTELLPTSRFATTVQPLVSKSTTKVSLPLHYFNHKFSKFSKISASSRTSK